jgi:NADPH-dependent ferric siderophore reductase
MPQLHIAPTAPSHEPERPPGRLAQTVLRLFTHAATVTRIETVSPHFRCVTLGIDNLRSARWTPGDKVQIVVDGLATRTFTPFDWNHRTGQFDLLLHVLGDTPAARWAAALQPGRACQVFGPRRSLALATLDGPALCFGDETSFSLALALQPRAWPTRFLFEVNDLVEARAVLHQIGLDGADLVERRADGSHRAEVEAALLQAAEQRFVLSGQSTSIQHLTQAFKRHGLKPARLLTKAYWAPGKVGLD